MEKIAPRDFCAGFGQGQTQLGAVTAAEFCATFATVCRYGVQGAYSSSDDCLTSYGAADDDARNCRVYRLCSEVVAAQILPNVPLPAMQAYCTGASTCAGTGGASGSGGDSGSGGTRGCGGATMDASAERPDASNDPLCGDHTYHCPVPGVATAAFCTRYGAICKFGAAGGYADLADCTAKYGAVSAAVKGCRAASLCDAISAEQNLPGISATVLRLICAGATSDAQTCM
ncbi:MAG TPA: hypothetical protein VNO55_12220 [Polyangia bacterium]|nr:hypothetical protein [Polyangia bacterium]